MARSGKPSARAAAAAALSRHPLPEDAQLLADAAADPSAAVRRAAAAGLARAMPERALACLLPLLADDDRSIRCAATEGVAELGPGAHAELLAALANPSLEDGALAGLERLPAPPREPILAYVRERSRLARELSHEAAVAAGGGEPAALLARSLRTLAERQSIRAVRAAGLLGKREAAGAAARGLASGWAAQRANALEAHAPAGPEPSARSSRRRPSRPVPRPGRAA